MAMCFSLVALGGRSGADQRSGLRRQDVSRVLRRAGGNLGALNLGNSLPPVIAIDGPSASGKGTVAQGVASALGFHYLNSGALYRTVAVAALKAGADLDNRINIVDYHTEFKC